MFATAELLHSVLAIPHFAREMSSSTEADTGTDTLTQLLSPVFALLSNSESSRERQRLVLDIVDLCVGYEEQQILQLSVPFLHGLLVNMKDYIDATTTKHRPNAEDVHRALGILERLLQLDHCQEILHPLSLALFAFLKTSRSDPSVLPILNCLTSLFLKASQTIDALFSADELWSFVSVLAAKVLKIQARECRSKLSDVFIALSAHLPSFVFSAEIFASLCSFVPYQVDEIDYDRRLDAFRTLTESFWSLEKQEEADLLLNACLFEMQNEKDFTLRQAASAALQKYSILFDRAQHLMSFSVEW